MTPFQFSFFAAIGLAVLGIVLRILEEVSSHGLAWAEMMREGAFAGAFMFMVATIFFVGTDTYRIWKIEQTRNPLKNRRSWHD